MIGSEKTLRGNGKWTKITHVAKGRFVIAQGYEGQFQCAFRHTLSNASDAKSWAESWINY